MLRFESATWDYGAIAASSAAIVDEAGEVVLRNAISTAVFRELEAPTYSEPVKVYVERPDQVPRRERDEDDDEDELPPFVAVYVDAGGFYYLEPRRQLTPGKYERINRRELEARMRPALLEWLRTVRKAGELLAGERLEP